MNYEKGEEEMAKEAFSKAESETKIEASFSGKETNSIKLTMLKLMKLIQKVRTEKN